MTGTIGSGFGEACVGSVERRSPYCRIGYRRLGSTACDVDNKPVNGWPAVTLWNKQRRTAKIQRACPMPVPFDDGYTDESFSLCCWARITATAGRFLAAPTIFAWDLGALCRMLRLKAKSP
jgi:hypothetical protein